MTNSLLAPSTLPFDLPDYAHVTDADFREAIEAGHGRAPPGAGRDRQGHGARDRRQHARGVGAQRQPADPVR
ncbi:hypothetical protein [Nocardioides sp. B-3]|uniref:hypothetical protein n=1 Tax=Nocardioides sp. B-3 TaxID=2895565 RepID=UPI002153972C|nr:hypothetical protein [Nocardioides sp. B-3]UUZ59275.1 hypothetical protein LP418_25995 [Nocardioides sp. B-3]